jgi:peptidoglycan-associated lipoprotein
VAILADGRPVSVVGHADERGSLDYNRDLGLDRAEVVKGFLRTQGVFTEKILSEGEESPVCGEQTESCWEANRRVEITVSR